MGGSMEKTMYGSDEGSSKRSASSSAFSASRTAFSLRFSSFLSRFALIFCSFCFSFASRSALAASSFASAAALSCAALCLPLGRVSVFFSVAAPRGRSNGSGSFPKSLRFPPPAPVSSDVGPAISACWSSPPPPVASSPPPVSPSPPSPVAPVFSCTAPDFLATARACISIRSLRTLLRRSLSAWIRSSRRTRRSSRILFFFSSAASACSARFLRLGASAALSEKPRQSTKRS
mmetsp:Transcript_11511/g.30547  ORF Transcript_11511/g.30547 Transcript_11511/m.30547 type:complete len:233 (+) Transcript_11511:584-1282(+)